MKKINLNQPKYVIPLFVLPFLFLMYYIFTRNDAPQIEQTASIEAKRDGINSSLPSAEEQEKVSRLQAYKDALFGVSDSSNINIEIKTPKEKRKLDSIKNNFKIQSDRRAQLSQEAEASRQRLIELTKEKPKRTPKPTQKTASVKTTNEMDDFKLQMRYLDSMQHPEKYLPLTPITEDTEIAYKIERNSARQNAHFNTIKADRDQTMITAILDEGIKAWEGSRVRVRLLEPIFVDGKLLEKGQYLYGICSGFDQQRILINIESVVIQDEIYPLNIVVHDNDGIQGVYIPNSQFRTFAKELGQNSVQGGGGQFGTGTRDQGSRMLYQSITQAYNSATRAVQQAFRKNKAKLKYNTEVYLVNNVD